MAQKVQVVLVDDLDGTTGDQTVTFSYNGVAYEIDLSNENADKFADVMAPYIGHARRVGSGRRQRRSSGSSSTSSGGPTPSQIRDWAREQGMEVNERGRISAELREKYEAANR